MHLAVALLRQEQGITPSLLAKAGADVAEVSRALDQALWNLPSRPPVRPCPTPGRVGRPGAPGYSRKRPST